MAPASYTGRNEKDNRQITNLLIYCVEPHKSRDNLAVMEEVPAAFTKVTSKKHRAKRSREEGRGVGQGAGQQGRESTASPTESLSSQAESTHQVPTNNID